MTGPSQILYSYFHAPISSVWTLGSWGPRKYECEMSAKQFELDGTIRGLTWRSELAFFYNFHQLSKYLFCRENLQNYKCLSCALSIRVEI